MQCSWRQIGLMILSQVYLCWTSRNFLYKLQFSVDKPDPCYVLGFFSLSSFVWKLLGSSLLPPPPFQQKPINIADNLEVKLEEKQQRFSRLKFLQNVGQEFHQLNTADERSWTEVASDDISVCLYSNLWFVLMSMWMCNKLLWHPFCLISMSSPDWIAVWASAHPCVAYKLQCVKKGIYISSV